MFSSNNSQVSNDAVFVEDIFSTYLYKGNDSTLSINNGIDVSGKGGLVWIKNRQQAGYYHTLVDTVRGPSKQLYSNTTNAQSTATGLDVTAFTSTGFTLGPDNFCNQNNANNVSWTFRKQPKFFDVVTYTGTGVARTIAHSLGSVPACIIVKCTNAAGKDWHVYHTSLGNTKYINLNLTSASTSSSTIWNSTTPTSTVFSLGADGLVNDIGDQYVAYLFAHNAGGFGLTGTDNVISCGSFTTDGSGYATVNLGYEPQWILWKRSDGATNWFIADSMRGLTTSDTTSVLSANLSNAEDTGYSMQPLSTGFKTGGAASATYIYIAIRRGPMKVPTSGTSVFSPVAYTGNGSTRTYSVGFPTDLSINMNRNGAGDSPTWNDRLRGSGFDLYSNSTGSEQNNGSAGVQFDNQTNIVVPSYRITNGTPYIDWCMRRAPSFFDEVCYTGTGVARTLNHNLGVVPELMIVKRRDGTSYGDWLVYHASLGNTKYLLLNTSDASATANSGAWNFTNPTSTQFTVGDWESLNTTATYVAYLFATCAGVSKVGSVTHSEPTTVSCGFTPRFVLIKSTQDTGTNDWFVFDSARGITSGNDPYLRLNSTGAENTPFGAADLIDPTADGFIMNGFGGGNYIYLAIA